MSHDVSYDSWQVIQLVMSHVQPISFNGTMLKSFGIPPPPLQLYEFVELFGEWGGYLGIFIGLSFLDIVYWITGMIDQKINSIVEGTHKPGVIFMNYL